jgi:uncharacterized protein (TIGR03067 family)
MKVFYVLAALAAVGLTGFSPAPFPRTERKREVDDMTALQGTYRVVEYGRPNMGGGAALIRRTEMKVQISGNKWTFQFNDGNAWVSSTSYEMKLQPRTFPRSLDMTYNANDYVLTMKGIYRIEGRKLTVAYATSYSGARFGAMPMDGERPTNFENLSGNAMLMKLERE